MIGGDSRGYRSILLTKDGKSRPIKVHRLVAIAFLGNGEGREVNHKDGVKTNNEAQNLEWCTRSQNQKHAYEMGLQSKPDMDMLTRMAALKTRRVVYQLEMNGKMIKKHDSVSGAGRETNINKNSIFACAQGKTKSGGDFRWVYP